MLLAKLIKNIQNKFIDTSSEKLALNSSDNF